MNAQTGKQRKRIIAIILILVIVIASAGTAAAIRTRAARQTPDLSEAVTYTVTRLSHSQTIEASGNIEAVRSQDAQFRSAGRIEEIMVEIGQEVEGNQLLAQLDDDRLRYELAQIDYSISQSRSSASPRELELLNMQRSLKLEELDDSQLRAEFSGIVSAVHAEIGDTATQGSPIMRIIDVSQMTAIVAIDEIDAPFIREGQRVEFIFDAYPEVRYNGYVSGIPREARITANGIAVLDVELMLSNPDASLKPAFTFTAEIFVSDAEDILVIDKNAVMSQAAAAGMGLALRVPAEEDERPQPVRVQFEEYDNDRYRVIAGLSEADVLLSPQSLASGERRLQAGGLLPPGAGRAFGDRPIAPTGAAPGARPEGAAGSAGSVRGGAAGGGN